MYKKWTTGILEVICYVSLVLFCLATFYTLKNQRAKAVVANTSVSITFVFFLGVLTYHVLTEVIAKVVHNKYPLFLDSVKQGDRLFSETFIPDPNNTTYTSTVVDGPTKTSETYDHELRELLLDESAPTY